MTNEKVFQMKLKKIYPLLVAKAEKKGRTRSEVDQVTCWLTGYSQEVLLALFLQAMYGVADLIIVGQFADTFEQSGVASGSQLFNMITMVITGLSMGVTVFVGDCIGAGKPEKAGKGIGTGIAIFAVLAVVVTAFVVPFSDTLASDIVKIS